MTEGTLPFGVPDAVAAAAKRRWDTSVGMGLLGRLSGADYLSLVALFFGWTSAVQLLQGDVHLGIVTMFTAMLFDKLDGCYARRYGVASAFGRQVDSFIDVFVYLVTAALLYHVALSPSPWATVVVGFAVVSFGGLRLVRHAAEGFGESDETRYYVGWTVVHVNFLVLAAFYADLLLGGVHGWIAAVLVVAACPLMVSGYKSYKTNTAHGLAAAFVIAALATSIFASVAGLS